MLIQHFTMKARRVPDPMRPGRTAQVGYLSQSGSSELSYQDASGKTVVAHPGENGWIEVPHEVGERLCQFRIKGSGFYSPDEIDENVRLDRFEGEPPAPPKTRRPAGAKTEE